MEATHYASKAAIRSAHRQKVPAFRVLWAEKGPCLLGLGAGVGVQVEGGHP